MSNAVSEGIRKSTGGLYVRRLTFKVPEDAADTKVRVSYTCTE